MTVHAEFIFADDIRQEANGKMLLVGVYPDGLSPSAFPAQFALALWVRLSGMPVGAYSVIARLKLDQSTLHDLTFAVSVGEPGKPLQLILGGIPIAVTQPATLHVTLETEALGLFAEGSLGIQAPAPPPT